MAKTTEKKSVYEILTEKFTAALEHGVIPWRKPWMTVSNLAYSGATGKKYNMLNQLLIDRPGWYYSKKHINALGLELPTYYDEEDGKTKTDYSKAYPVFSSFLKKRKKDETEEEFEKRTKYSKYSFQYYYVWNEDDIPGMKKHEPLPERNHVTSDDAESVMNSYLSRERIKLEYQKQNQAYYAPALDMIVLPMRDQFEDIREFYSTAFHEMTHSTGHPTRLNRIKDVAKFGSEEYSKEELIAEIGSACILQTLGIDTPQTFENSAAYIENWLKALKSDMRMISMAAQQAEKAVELILGKESA